jgi:hypothetical protein
MPRKKKTIDVDWVRTKINHMLRVSVTTPDIRYGNCVALELILMETNNYKGFRYLTQDEVPRGQKPGIIPRANHMSEPTFPDESRREYYV